jgi:hypothetical protein
MLRGIPGANIDGAGSLAWRASASFSANGQRPRDNNFLLDGVDNNETWLQTVVIFPNVDSLDEFKLQTSTYSAEFGRSLGGVVNLQIKSGSNKMTGSAFEFHRDSAFDANDFFNNRAGRAKPQLKQNQFGGTAGGPIFKNKTFFFGSYQGSRLNQGQTFLSTVPTDAMRSGDFSALNRTIFDPSTGQPFQNNTIPGNEMDPVAVNILKLLYPAPNTAGTRQANGQIINNYLINPTQTRHDDQVDTKVDHNLTDANRFFVRYSFEKTHRVQPATLPHGDAGATFGAGDGNVKAGGRCPTTRTSSRAICSTKGASAGRRSSSSCDADRLRHQSGQLGRAAGHQSESGDLGDDAVAVPEHPQPGRQQQPAAHHQPERLLARRQPHVDARQAGDEDGRKPDPAVARNPQRRYDRRRLQLQQQHDVELRRSARWLTGQQRDRLRRGELPARAHVGQEPQSFCCENIPRSGPEIGAYAQDDYRMTRTHLNLGLRARVPAVDRGSTTRQSNFDPSTGASSSSRRRTRLINGVHVGRYLQTYSKGDFGPRVGAAYDLNGDGKTILRGGFGIYWNFSPGGTSSSKAQNPPFLQSTAQSPTPSAYGNNLLLKDGLPAPPGVDPNRVPQGTTRSAFDVNFRDAYARQWNVNAQRGLGTNYLIEVAYVGSQGRQMMIKSDYNQAPPVLGVTDANVNRPFAAVDPKLQTVGYASSTGTLDYNALQAKFQRRFANNFSFLNSYTWGQAIDLSSDNDGTVTLTNIFDPATTAARPTTTSSTRSRRAGCTKSPGGGESGTAAGS